jgi:hypothetical protein
MDDRIATQIWAELNMESIELDNKYLQLQGKMKSGKS